MMLAAGCNSQGVTRGPVDARAAGGLDARSGRTLVPSDLAFGRDVALAERSGDRARAADVDAYLKPTPLAAKRPASKPATPPRKQPAPKPAPALPAPPMMALAPEAKTTTQTDENAPQLLAAATLPGGDAERYAQREQRSRDLSGYRGGDAIVITSGALIVALLIVLLIVLLT
jgi:hypothetical protein